MRAIARKHNTSILTTVAHASRSPAELANQLVARAPGWILALLIVLLSVRAALLVVDLASAPYVPAGRPVQPPAAAVSRKVVDIPSILRANLFGQSPPATGTDAPVTAMNLKLVLVFAASDEKKGLAALGPSLTDIKVYKVGDSVPGGATLHAVYVDRVLLDRSGAIEALLVPPRAGQATASAPPPPLAANPAASLARVQQVMQKQSEPAQPGHPAPGRVRRWQLRGMRVNPGPNAQAFTRLGLRPGDLVTGINGTAAR